MAGSSGGGAILTTRRSKFGRPVQFKKARIEIIPLIDVMFFLLAAFMMVSLSMTKVASIKLNLPAAREGHREFRPDIFNIAVDRSGDTWIEKDRKALPEILGLLTNKFHVNTNLTVFVSGDRDASHRSIVQVLQIVRSAGIQKVSFSTVGGAEPAKESN